MSTFYRIPDSAIRIRHIPSTDPCLLSITLQNNSVLLDKKVIMSVEIVRDFYAKPLE